MREENNELKLGEHVFHLANSFLKIILGNLGVSHLIPWMCDFISMDFVTIYYLLVEILGKKNLQSFFSW